MNPSFLLTIDVEDWFQVENFKSYIPYATWDSRELRVERNTHRLLDLFDSVEGSRVRGFKGSREINRQNRGIKNSGVRRQEKRSGEDPKSGSWEERKLAAGSEERTRTNITHGPSPIAHCLSPNSTLANEIPDRDERSGLHRDGPLVRATFFVLGWIAERLPGLVREIHDRGHEVASHGFGHEMCSRQSPAALKADLVKSKQLLEDIIGTGVCGYRAPSFSVDNDILKIIEDSGYRYDSSYNSFSLHGRYGKVSFNGQTKNGIAQKLSNNFYELPISNLKLNIQNSKLQIPLGGGAYFRLLPFPIFNTGIRSILNRKSGYLFYMHPWEIDPDQPRVNQASAFFKFRHYVNLHKTEGKLKRMIRRFGDCRFRTCRDYLGVLATDRL